jgi:hypothetical protein
MPTGELSIAIPKSWDHEPETGTLKVYSGTPDIQSENCDRGRTSVIFQVLRQEGGTGLPDYPPRPRHFTVRSGSGLLENIADLGDCRALNQWIQFTEQGRRYAASVTFGRDVSTSQRTAAYEVLDSLRISN